MKMLYSLTQPLMQLRRTPEHLRAWLSLRGTVSSDGTTDAKDTTASRCAIADVSTADQAQASESTPQHWHRKLSNKTRKHKSRPPVMWVVAVVSLTSAMGNRFYNQPKLDVGTAAPQTIRAPQTARVEDTKTTEEKRKAARTGAVPVLMFDRSLTQDIYQALEQSLDRAQELRQQCGPFPFAETTILSEATQRYLRQTKEVEWRAILAQVNSENVVQPTEPGILHSERIEELRHILMAQAVSELRGYRQMSSPQAFSALLESIALARQGYTQALRQLSAPLESKSGRRYDPSLLDLSDRAWHETRIGLTTASKRILTQGIPPGLPPQILKDAVKMQVATLVPPDAEPLATQMLLSVLQPNLTEDKEETKRMAEQAAQAVQPMMVSAQQGEVIVYAGEQITQADFVLLDYFGLSRRGISWSGLVGFGCVVTTGMVIFWLVERRVHPRLRRRDHILLWLLALSTPLLVIFKIPYTNLPAIGLLAGSFYSPALGVTVVGMLTGLVMFGMKTSWEYLVAGACAGVLGAWMAGRMRSREELAWLGSVVGLTQGGAYLLLSLIPSAAIGSVWYAVFQEAAVCGLAGLSWSIVALGISPYLERLFDLITPIRLAELSNPNRPLLKRLATEAPGTFQHTLFVASLAEAAARELHCNVELVRAGTLYHDIGKMHDPLGFIENQMGGPNKHDEINDPWISAEIIKKHVAEGLVMARKHQLPKAIRDFIPEHQGTLLISYFYFQAKQKADQEGGSPVNEADFRYDGPVPQSRETGLVMLADACEAALRSLKDVTPETALGMINKILKARWQDNQLVDSGLTREELSIIAEVFVRVWQQCNHKRIAYPKAALNHQP
jgi:putative nucleotidyltransferase with HDIG domain